ncbi:MAG TPA: leucine-rich repeat protein [Candidatus Paceibacterota bacterium]|nr:leucine-rich repeat protein [Candidatus Paceibacterota bacterium]
MHRLRRSGRIVQAGKRSTNPNNTPTNHSRHYAGRLLPLLLLLVLSAAVQAQFNYTTNNGTITITGYTGQGGAVTIPDTIEGLPVTSIGYRTFLVCTRLTSVMIPDSVTSIGGSAFQGCTSLISVTIGNAFTDINALGMLDYPRLALITVGESNASYSSMDGVLFNKNRTMLIRCPKGKGGS